MIRPFSNGQKIYFRSDVRARSTPSPTASIILVDQGAHGVVAGYSTEATQENQSDDFVGVHLTSGDEATGQEVWVQARDFTKLSKSY